MRIERTSITRAIVTLTIEDGTVIVQEGKPEETSVSYDSTFAPTALDSLCVGSNFKLPELKTEADTSIKWRDVTMTFFDTRWWPRFKRWLKEMPLK